MTFCARGYIRREGMDYLWHNYLFMLIIVDPLYPQKQCCGMSKEYGF